MGFASAAQPKPKSDDRYDIHTGCGQKGMMTWIGKVQYKISKWQYLVDFAQLGRNDQLYRWFVGLWG